MNHFSFRVIDVYTSGLVAETFAIYDNYLGICDMDMCDADIEMDWRRKQKSSLGHSAPVVGPAEVGHGHKVFNYSTTPQSAATNRTIIWPLCSAPDCWSACSSLTCFALVSYLPSTRVHAELVETKTKLQSQLPC